MANPAQPTPYKGSGKLRPEELIYQEMLGAILDRRLEPGMKLIEEDLAKTFSVSRARIRATFLQLAHDKLINLVPNRGAFIAEPTIDEAIEVFSARRMIEDGVVRKIAANMTPDRASQIREHLEREHQAHHDGDHRAAIILSGEFHLLLARLAGNLVIEEFLERLILRSSLIIAMYESPQPVDCSHSEHESLLNALLGGEPDVAAAEMAKHLDAIRDRLQLQRPKPAKTDFASIFGRNPKSVAS
ncbi:GntR family transcriptional regulator [Thalassospira permensis]|uniref:GntR family transcriptional regulator n=1 Tax=Thalassospira permensis NBRC 106175 TaxID=1353532 RepID=A0ABR4TR84_9PROT|nr:GntR family transcriptional regulator [Thalassospira permensis]KEO58249.1 GntR family transcriptional regulator [Thalassospira permensis NBRC 106175]